MLVILISAAVSAALVFTCIGAQVSTGTAVFSGLVGFSAPLFLIGFLVRKKMIRCQLLANESCPRRVAIEAVDDIIPVTPSVRPKHIMFAAMRIGEVNGIKPVPRPAFSVTRRGQ